MAKRSLRPVHRGKPSWASPAIRLFVVPGMPEVRKGDDLAKLISDVARQSAILFEDGDIIVIAQKIVSKAEGRLVRLSSIKASAEARRIASKLKKEPKFIEVVLRESRRIVRSYPVLIVETHHGLVCANAGVDRSNVLGRDAVTLLPREPDRSAKKLAVSLRQRTGKRIAVIISDTFGRPWRLGLTNVAIGAAGIPALLDLRGKRDRAGKSLHATILAVADELTAAAGLVMSKAGGTPVVVIRGYRYQPADEPAASIIRPANEDLFR